MNRKPALSIDRIVDAATALADDRGLDVVTIRGVANQLNASPMALYNHITDRADLLVHMLEKVASEFPVESPANTPVDRVTDLLLRQHDVLAPRPWVIYLLARGELLPRGSLPHLDALMRDILAMGHPPTDAVTRLGMCWHFLLGELADRHPQLPPDRPTQRERVLLTMDTAEFPHYAVVLTALDPPTGPMDCPIHKTLPRVIQAICA